jgi:ATP-dependent DNA helicase RecQ
VLGEIRKRIPAGARGELALADLVRGLGPGWSDEAAEAALGVLAASGAVRILAEHRGEGEAGRALTLGVHRGALDPERARRLRAAALAKLAEVTRYARARGCRRRVLLGYFGETNAPDRCGACDRCLGKGNPLAVELGPKPGGGAGGPLRRALLGGSGRGYL